MPLAQTFYPSNRLFYVEGSKADLSYLKAFLDALHQNMNYNLGVSGGSVEDWEANVIRNLESTGLRYEAPRENFDQVDRLVVTAENSSGDSERHTVDFEQDEAESKAEATVRWINTARQKLIDVRISLEIGRAHV